MVVPSPDYHAAPGKCGPQPVVNLPARECGEITENPIRQFHIALRAYNQKLKYDIYQ
jgi:hypothetical protein